MLIKFRLRTHFKNARKRLNTAVLEIIEKRILFGKSESPDDESGTCSIAI